MGWSEASAEVARWMAESGPWVIEGVATPRALRKWLKANPGAATPADRIVWLDRPFEKLSPGQETMTKGVATVWREVLPELQRRGVLMATGVHALDDSLLSAKAGASSSSSKVRLPLYEREIQDPPRGEDGLFAEPAASEYTAKYEEVERHRREGAANHFKYADPWCGNPRTYDPDGRYNCGRCNQYEQGQCLLVDIPSVNPDAGSCGDWEDRFSGDPETDLTEKSVDAAGYAVAANGDGFGCFRCPYGKPTANDSMGRDWWCGKFAMRTLRTACCAINGAEVVPSKGAERADMADKTTSIQLDLGVGEVHQAGAGDGKKRDMSVLRAKKRNSLKPNQFALPEERKYPIHDANHVRNAAARLQGQKKRGMISGEKYSKARAAIARAAKRFGIDSVFNAADDAPGTSGATGSAPAPDRRSRVPRSITVRADLAPGGALHVRHMSDRAFWDVEGVKLSDTDSAGDAPVWIQVAKQGAFAGHPAGPFRLDAQAFEEIIANFKSTANRMIPVDYEHASEQDPTHGSIPVSGAPAQGWIKELAIRDGNLWGLVEWLPQAREQIRAGQYRYLSPAIRFGSKDRVTGRNIGARMTSAALTNEPFLDGMEPLAAKDNVAGAATAPGSGAVLTLGMGSRLEKPMHQPGEYMPQLKAALRLDPLCSMQECSDQLGRLRECCMSVGMDGHYMGESMGQYTRPLRELLGASPGMTGEQLFDTIEDLIQHAIDSHVAEMHPGGAHMDDTDPAGDDFAMTDKDIATQLSEAKGSVVTLTNRLSTLRVLLKLKEEDNVEAEVAKIVEAVNLADKRIGALGVTLKLTSGETVEQGIARILDENGKLLKDKSDRFESDLQADVDSAFETYKDQRKLTDTHKPAMLSHARADRAGFHVIYPPVAPSEQHLLREIVPPAPKPPPGQQPRDEGYTDLTRRIMREQKVSLSEAQIRAAEIIRNRNRQSDDGEGK